MKAPWSLAWLGLVALASWAWCLQRTLVPAPRATMVQADWQILALPGIGEKTCTLAREAIERGDWEALPQPARALAQAWFIPANAALRTAP